MRMLSCLFFRLGDPASLISELRSNVFLGLALDRQNQNDASEAAYKEATRIKIGDQLAWQGLVTLYEKQAGQKLDDYHSATLHLAEIFMQEYVL